MFSYRKECYYLKPLYENELISPIPSEILIYKYESHNSYTVKLFDGYDYFNSYYNLIYTPKFENIRWILYFDDTPSDIILDYITLGLARTLEIDIYLIGEYNNEIYDLRCFVKDRVLKNLRNIYRKRYKSYRDISFLKKMCKIDIML